MRVIQASVIDTTPGVQTSRTIYILRFVDFPQNVTVPGAPEAATALQHDPRQTQNNKKEDKEEAVRRRRKNIVRAGEKGAEIRTGERLDVNGLRSQWRKPSGRTTSRQASTRWP
jgi:hypothetical protein